MCINNTKTIAIYYYNTSTSTLYIVSRLINIKNIHWQYTFHTLAYYYFSLLLPVLPTITDSFYFLNNVKTVDMT